MKNYNDIFIELKNYFSNNIRAFKREINARIEGYEKSAKYFNDNLDKKVQTDLNNFKNFMADEKESINNLIKENTELKVELELLKTSLINNKELIKKEIYTDLIQDNSFINKVIEKTIERLEI